MSMHAHPQESKPWLSAYPPGVPATIGPVTQTLPEMLAASIGRYPDDTALEFFGARTSYRRLGQQVARVAEGLRRLGVAKGDRVALVLPNCPQHVVAFYAVLRLGAIVVEHNPLYTADELTRQFDDHGARVAIVWDKACATVAGFPPELRPKHLVSVDITEAMPAGKRLALRLPIAKARAARRKLTTSAVPPEALPWRRLDRGPALSSQVAGPCLEDVALLQYTSGTTGHPKGAILTHRNLRANAMQGRAWIPGLAEGEETFYAVLPLFHAYGLTLCLTFALSLGAKLVLFPTFDVALVAQAARKSPPTFLPAVPPMYDQLSRAAGRGELDLRTVRFSISGAMSLPVATVQEWEEASGGLLVEGYGMTETSPVALGNPMGPGRRPGAVGIPFPSTDIRVVDPEDPSVEVTPGEPGELLVRGPQVFAGYWGRPEDTEEALLAGGWLRTGDIVTVSDDGFVTVVDRLKEIIVTGGFNVSPTEVEDVLRTFPGVADAAVVGLPRGQGGELVAAAIVLGSAARPDIEEMRAYCRTKLAAYKLPRRFFVVEDLPRSLIGKTLRREVRDRLLAGRSGIEITAQPA